MLKESNHSVNRIWKSIWMIVFYVAFFVLLVGVIKEKANYHVDEVYSYGLANNRGSIRMDFKPNKKYTPAAKAYMNYMTVDSQDRFHYDIVWENQTNDVHPPLYYILLHTISSIRPQTFSRWYAGSINILFALLTLFVLQRYSRLLSNENKFMPICLSLLFILSAGVLSCATFFRMYMMAMFWITLLEYEFSKEVEKEEGGWRFFAKVYLVAVLGALTHYYCIIFTVFLCGTYCIILLMQKKYKRVLAFVGTGALAAGTAILLFPAMLTHMFSGYRGKESIENLNAPVSDYLIRLKYFFHLVDIDLFGGLFLCLIFGGIVISLIARFTKKSQQTTVCKLRYALIFIPCFLYFLVISKMAVFISARYMYPIYAIMLIGLFGFLADQLQRICEKKVWIFTLIFLFGVLTVFGWKQNEWTYLYKNTEPLLEASEQYRDLDCIYVFDARYKTHCSFMEVKNYNSVIFASGKHPEKMLSYDLEDKDEIIVMITAGREDVLDYFLRNNPKYTGCDVVGSYEYTTTYHLYMDS